METQIRMNWKKPTFKRLTWIDYVQMAGFVVLMVLLVVSNKASYEMGLHNGPILFCEDQGMYLANTIDGAQCVDQTYIDENYDRVGDRLIKKDPFYNKETAAQFEINFSELDLK